MKKRWAWIILLIVLFAVLITVFVLISQGSNTNRISSTDLKEYITEEAEHVADGQAQPKYMDKTIDKLSFNASVGKNTVEISGVLSLSGTSNSSVKYSSTWSSSEWNAFVSNMRWISDSGTNYKLAPAGQNGTLNALDVASDVLNGGSKSTINGGVKITDRDYVPVWEQLIVSLLPIIIIVIVLVWLMVRFSKSQGGAGGMNPFSMGKSRARQIQSTVKFSDVAGINEEKEELVELVDYLKNPQKYAAMGARAPKGVLMEGPPGTGKTLLAKAVAGEAGVPFFSISGSEFEEMFVGVGASRIREMFNDAKKNAPCIIFIDEIDAVGRKRTASFGSGTNEQTLNQLLVEMDGFGTNTGVIVMAATNRVDVLDPALLRPGRFDRQIQISLPDIKEREAILKLHARNKNVSSEVDFHRLAERTPGFSGAQLENVFNEAAILAVRQNVKVITVPILDEAIDRVVGGPAKKSREYTITDKDTVSYHEAGHALIGLKLEAASKVQKVTIIPRGQAGGYTIMTPKEETMFHSKENLYATITGYLGGRASEELMFGKTKITTGAHDDLEKATNIARHMVTEYGMSPLGLVQFESTRDMYAGQSQRWWSEDVASKIDIEIKKILDDCYEAAKSIISANREELALIADSLKTLETITAEQIEYIDKHMQLPKEVLEEKEAAKVREEKKQKGDILEIKPKKDRKPQTDSEKTDNQEESTPSEDDNKKA